VLAREFDNRPGNHRQTVASSSPVLPGNPRGEGDGRVLPRPHLLNPSGAGRGNWSISPWNYPLQMAAWKILPAIAAGNNDSPQGRRADPLTSLLFAEVATDAGIPPARCQCVHR
jgi:hypothetical protein